MPNADTKGLYLREQLLAFIDQTPNAKGVENLGSKGYLSCMKHCRIVLGNSSSGFIEAKGFLDEELRIDIIINKKEEEVGGIQVKPATFKLMRREVVTFNKNANQKWGRPVFYLFYDDKEKFMNLDELVDLIRKL